MDEQLKAIRDEKHKEYLQNTSCKSPSQENIVIETYEKNDRDSEQPNDTHDNNEVKSFNSCGPSIPMTSFLKERIRKSWKK